MASYAYTFQSGDGVTPPRLNAARTVSDIVDADISASAAIAASKLAGTLDLSSKTVTLPDASVAQAKLAANVAGNGPVFRARLGSAQTVANGASPKLNLNTEFFDVGGFYDTSLYRFTPTVAGYYQINLGVYSSAGATELLAMIYRNGSEYARGASSNATSSRVSTVSDIVFLNGISDFVEGFVFHQNGTGASATLDAGARTFISGALIRSV